MLFGLTGQQPHYRSISPALFLRLSAALRPLGYLSDWVGEKAEYLRIAHYYATESMLVWDAETEAYSSEATPETGQDTLEQHYRMLLDQSDGISVSSD